MSRPDFEELQSVVNKSGKILFQEDEILLRRGVSEWSIAHRFAVYLEQLLASHPEWDIDCEFNRQPFDKDGEEFSEDQTKKVGGDITRPDIIVHKRADPGIEYSGDNLLAIELKVNSEEDGDVDEIKAIMREKLYDFGIFIDLFKMSNESMNWDSSFLKWVRQSDIDK